MEKPDIGLVDGDAILFKAGFANQKTVKGKFVSSNPPSYAFKTCKDLLVGILKETEVDELKIFLADKEKSNFRYKVAKSAPYKANRKTQERPVLEKEIREYLIKNWDAYVVIGAEVDDALGIEQSDNTIICSNDKDLDMIPGWHYDIDVGRKRTINGKEVILKSYKKTKIYKVVDPGFLSLREQPNGKKILIGAGQFWFCAQLLLGDSVDNIPSVAKGWGPVRVYNSLCGKEKGVNSQTYRQMFGMVWDIYKNEGRSQNLTIDEIRARIKEMAQLLWIKRKEKEKIFPEEWLI